MLFVTGGAPGPRHVARARSLWPLPLPVFSLRPSFEAHLRASLVRVTGSLRSAPPDCSRL